MVDKNYSPSLIIELIKTNNDWRNILNDKNIKIKEDNNFLIFNYSIGCDFSDPIVKEARGIIIDKNTLTIACWPFSKFFNSHEKYADKIDWNTARVQEKCDGSIIKLFFNNYTNSWQWATNSTINAANASSESMFSDNFLDIINKADNLKDIPFNDLNRNFTYIFELVGPENRVVVYYPNTHLYHIGTRDNISGNELNTDIGIEKPKTYPLKSFDNVLEAVKTLNTGDSAEHEGFVVVDGNWRRIKVKTPEYLMFHHFANGVLLNKSKVIELINSDDVNITDIIKQFPAYENVFSFYINEQKRIVSEVSEFINYSRHLFEETDRKTAAIEIKKNKYSFIGFQSLNNNKTAEELLASIPKSAYEKLFNDYSEEEFQKENKEEIGL